MTTLFLISDQVRESTLGFAEIRHSHPKGGGYHYEVQTQTRHVEIALAPKQTPAEAIDDSHRRVQAVEKPPLRRNHCAGETDRRYVHPELHDERDDEAEIPVLHIESRDVKRRPKTGQHSKHDEQR